MINLNRQVAPTGEIKGPILLVDGASDTLIQKRESALNGSYVDGKVGAIKNQYLAIEQGGA